MEKILKFLVGFVLGLIIFYLVVSKAGLDLIRDSFQFFLSWEGLLIIALTFLISGLAVLRWRMILSYQGEKVNLSKLTGIWMSGFLVDYITPISLFGGEALRVYFAKNILKINLEKSFSSVIVDKIMDSTFHIIFLILGLVVFFSFGTFPEKWIGFLVFLVIFFLISFLIFFYFRAFGKKSITLFILSLLGLKKTEVKATKNGEFIFNIEGNVLRFFSLSEPFFWKNLLLSFFRHLFIYLRALMILFFVVGGFYPLKALAVQGLSYLSLLLPLPAGLGSLEAISSYGFELMSFDFQKGVLFAIIWRSSDLIICFIGFLMAIKLGINIIKLKIISITDTIKENIKNKF